MDSSASRFSTQLILSAVVVRGLLTLGKTIPIIGKFAEVLQKTLKVIQQASCNEKAVVRLHNHAVTISGTLLSRLRLPQLSRITGFDDALNRLMELLEDISSYINKHQTSLSTKVSSAIDTNLVTQVNNYIQNLTDHKNILMDLIAIDTNIKLTYIAEAKKNSEDHDNSNDFPEKELYVKDNSRAPVHQDVEDSFIDEEAISKNTQVSKASNNERSKFHIARDKFERI